MSQDKLERYKAYKDSGVEWLGEVPAHWKISHLKRFCKKITDGAHSSPDLLSNDYPFLTVVNLNNGKLDFDHCLFTSRIDYEKLVRNGCKPEKYDVLYSKDGTISETVVVNEDRNFVVGSSFIIIRPNLKTSNSGYLSYLLTSDIMRYQARIYVKGASLPRISIFNIAKLMSVLPSLPEQSAIAAYLDNKTVQIDRKIDLLSQKATQYGQLKQALINETVTRGLDKTVEMKDSGVEWLGEVPAHWEVKRLKDYSTQSKEKNGLSPVGVMLSVSGYRGIEVKVYGDEIQMRTKEELADYRTVHPGQLVVNTMWLNYRGIGVSQYRGYVSPAYRVYYLESEVVGSFLHYLMRSDLYVFGYTKYLQGIRPNSLQMKTIDFECLPIVMPVKEEQIAIAHYLDEKNTHIDRIIATIYTQIDKLQELRKTLINDVVTGKIKVVTEGQTP